MISQLAFWRRLLWFRGGSPRAPHVLWPWEMTREQSAIAEGARSPSRPTLYLHSENERGTIVFRRGAVAYTDGI